MMYTVHSSEMVKSFIKTQPLNSHRQILRTKRHLFQHVRQCWWVMWQWIMLSC